MCHPTRLRTFSVLLGSFSMAIGAACASADEVDALLEPGDTFSGRIAFAEDVDLVQVQCLAGARLDVKVKAASGAKLDPLVSVRTAGGKVLAPAQEKVSADGRAHTLLDIPIDSSGPYDLVVSSANGKLGSYRLEVDEHLQNNVTQNVKLKGTAVMVEFAARAGGQVNATVMLPKGPTFEVSIADPGGEVLVAGDAWSTLDKPGVAKLAAGPVALPVDGVYRLCILGSGGKGQQAAVAIHVSPAPQVGGEHVEANGEVAVSGVLDLGDGQWLDGSEVFVAGEVLVELDGPVVAEELAAQLECAVVARSGRWARLRSAAGGGVAADDSARRDAMTLLLRARHAAGVVRAEWNHVRAPLQIPSDPLYPAQWNLPLAEFDSAWSISDGDAARAVAVLDTGVWLTHPDLAGRLLPGMDFVSDTWNAGDGNGVDGDATDPFLSVGTHGTHVAGIIAAVHDNGTGIAGATRHGRVLPVRVLGVLGGTDFDIAQGILFAAGLPNAAGVTPAVRADVINMSLGGPNYSAILADAVRQAIDADVVVVAAAGNTNSSKLLYPAAYPGVITVAATNLQDQRAWYSTFGPQIDLAAPGGDTAKDKDADGENDGVLSAIATFGDGSTWGRKAGTSMATPHVSAAALLLRSAVPDLSPVMVNGFLCAGALDLGQSGFDDLYGHGRLDAARSLVLATGQASGAAELFAVPQIVRFTPDVDLMEVALINRGAGDLEVSSVTSAAPWLRPIDLSAEVPGSLRVAVDRATYASGEYTGTLTLTTALGETQVPVVMVVATDGPVAIDRVFVTAIDVIGDRPPVVFEVAEDGAADVLLKLPEGSYRLIAATDLDHDGSAGEAHDYTWEYADPITAKPKVALPDGTVLAQVHIDLALLGGLSIGPVAVDG